MASRAVMNESAKCRSGRDGERTVATRPCGRGGKSADAFCDHEGVPTQDDRNVMMPAWERATFKVIEAELALEILVHSLGTPALLDVADDLLVAHASREGGEEEFGRLLFALRPFGHEPKRFALGEQNPVVVGGLDAHETKAGIEFGLGAFAPGQPTEGLHSAASRPARQPTGAWC